MFAVFTPCRRVSVAPQGGDFAAVMKPPAVELPRRFYKSVDTAPVTGGFGVRLDGRTPRSPGGRPLVLPTAALADLVAADWAAQGDFIRMADMAATRLAHTALDAVPAAHAETTRQVAAYAASDALCYRAEAPRGLVERQAAAWDPLLAWASEALGVDLQPVTGIMHRAQPDAAIGRVRALAATQDSFALAGLAFATALFGSAVLALAAQQGWLTAEQAYELSRLDEAFQEEQWGVDAEAALRTERLRADAAMLQGWFAALR
jgi:chaperone required for assembly of F1-ATPase